MFHMLAKEALRKEFAKEWKEHYELEIFRQEGFTRKVCPKCLKAFWTLDANRIVCGDPPCENYGFIGKTITKEKFDYVETWKAFEKFFRKNGHESVQRYPVIDRWRPDLYFTIASIQDFQRMDQGNLVMEYPADPLIVPQVCLRFNDVPNVGVTGRHHTCFIMPGQHSFGKYWKDRCIELNFRFLTEALGIPKEQLSYVEDMWTMPDFSQFGPSIETFSKGLELVNSVFSQFTASGSGYVELPQKVIDVGWGHERLVWFSQGTPTGYDAVFQPVTDWMKKQAGLQKTDLFGRYAVLSGGLDMDDSQNIRKERERVANSLGVSVDELAKVVEPMQAIYAIADHTKALLFAVADGGIPSNVGGGYNLRVILRRALSFIREFGFTFNLDDVAKLHAKQLKPMFPELAENLEPFSRVVGAERKRYEKTMETAGMLVKKELKKSTEIDEQTMIRLYTSNGITPELIEKVARQENVRIEAPEDFYAKVTEQHVSGKKEGEERIDVDVSGLPATRLLFYEQPYTKEFDAKVLSVTQHAGSEWVVLDQTCFFAEGGGQLSDSGKLICNGKVFEVSDVQRIKDVILHKTSGLNIGDSVRGIIDWERRSTLMKMHTGTHILAGAARKIIGRHVWQAGAQKGLKSSRIDLTHYNAFTDEELGKIEKLANEIVKKDAVVTAQFMPRGEAEKTYGFVLYQGGASPGKQVRVVNVDNGFDVEACAGTHLKSAGDIGEIRIIKSERIQDGVNRIEFTCGAQAQAFRESEKQIFDETLKAVSEISGGFKKLCRHISRDNTSIGIATASAELSVEPRQLPRTASKFAGEMKTRQEEVNKLGKVVDAKETGIDELLKDAKAETLGELAALLFSSWKKQGKLLEKLRNDAADAQAKSLLAKEKDNTIFEAVPYGRKEMIAVAEALLKQKSGITIILVNKQGEVVVMSKIKDAGAIAGELCGKAGGSGGGSRQLGQGKADFGKLKF